MRKTAEKIISNPIGRIRAVLKLPDGTYSAVPIIGWQTNTDGNPEPMIVVGQRDCLIGYQDMKAQPGRPDLLRFSGAKVHEFSELEEPEFS